MSLYKQWQDIAYREKTQEEYDAFWNDYLPKETSNYEYILENKDEVVRGKLKDLAEKFNMDLLYFTGFLDGINTSLVNSIDLDSLAEESDIELEIDFEKLYYNMLEAKAEWLYTLEQWNDVLTMDRRKEIKKEHNKSKTVVREEKISRNEPCPCGSGKKYKKCCSK